MECGKYVRRGNVGGEVLWCETLEVTAGKVKEGRVRGARVGSGARDRQQGGL